MNDSNTSNTRKSASLWLLVGLFLGLSGCVSVKTEHKVEPIHITMDVNVRLEKELDDAFSQIDAKTTEIAKKGAE